MPAGVTFAQLNAALPGPRIVMVNTPHPGRWMGTNNSIAAGHVHSTWRATSGSVDVPTTAEVVTGAHALAAAVPHQATKTTYLASVMTFADQVMNAFLVDRLVHVKVAPGAVGTVTVNTPNAPRHDERDVELWVENNVTVGATAPVFTIAYVDSGGVARTTDPYTITASTTGGRSWQIPLVGGNGIRSITSINFTAINAADEFNLVLQRDIIEVPGVLRVNQPVQDFQEWDWLRCGLVPIHADAALSWTTVAGSTSARAQDVVMKVIRL